MKKINFNASDLSETFGTDVNAAVKHAQSFMGEYPERPTKPKLLGDTSAAHREYATLLEGYEGEKSSYDAIINGRQAHEDAINQILEEYVKNVSGLNTIVPEEFRSKVYYKAYEDGHAHGFSSIYNELIDLVYLFKI